MIAQDVITQLAANLPLLTDGFSTAVSINSISVSGTVATVTTDGDHGIVEDQTVSITGVESPVAIDIGSFVRNGTKASFLTLQDHDLTLSARDLASGGLTITISGANQSEFNGTFELLSIPNRRSIDITVDDSGPVSITGSPIVNDAAKNAYNGVVTATNITNTTFDYDLSIGYDLDPYIVGASVATELRMLAVLNIDHYLNNVYTKKTIGDDTLVIQLNDTTGSKGRSEQSDATYSISGKESYDQILIKGFSVFVIQNTTVQLAGADARDKIESVYGPAIMRSLLRVNFATGFTSSQKGTTYVADGVYAYADQEGKSAAIYAHEFQFQQLVQLTNVDVFDTTESVAMRDVNFKFTTNLGTGELDADIDLDEEPL